MNSVELPNLQRVMLDWLYPNLSLWDLREWLLADGSEEEKPEWSSRPLHVIEELTPELPTSQVNCRRLIAWTYDYEMSLAAQTDLAYHYRHALSGEQRDRLRRQSCGGVDGRDR